eukprot:255668-Chlamydomonas_euryale.AAC.6
MRHCCGRLAARQAERRSRKSPGLCKRGFPAQDRCAWGRAYCRSQAQALRGARCRALRRMQWTLRSCHPRTTA